MYTYVVTNPELGWDCIIGVYNANFAEDVEEFLIKENDFEEFPEEWLIHEVTVRNITGIKHL